MNIRARSLFTRTAITIAVTLLLFTLIAVGAAKYFIMNPMAKRYSDDFAAVIVSAAHSLQALPEEMHEELKQQLLHDHGLTVAMQKLALEQESSDVTYYQYFREALERRAGPDLTILESGDGPLMWVDVPAHGNIYRLGFDRERLGTNPPVALLLAIAAGALLTFLASLVEVRRVVMPLSRLSVAVEGLGGGRYPPPLPEDGPDEIAKLARALNRMSSDLKEMSENRTVMLAGISHDLRTPLTRLAIAIEMLDQDSRPEIINGLRRDLDAINNLIGEFLRFSQEADDEVPVQVDLWQVIESLTTVVQREGTEVRLHRKDPPCVYFADPIALERVLANLLTNAVQYGAGAPIDVTLQCNAEAVTIEISDRGPGIPQDQLQAVFRPFLRLDGSRGHHSGGSGLGLAIARQLANKHDWKIELLPRDGGGTVAQINLPPAHRFGLRQSCYRAPAKLDEALVA